MYHHDASRAQHAGDQNSSPVHSYPQISPLTPPDHFDLHGYRQPPHMHAPRAGVPRQGAFAPYGVGTHSTAAAAVVDPASAFPFEGAQLWNMDGAPASPPPMPEFHGFFPPPSHPHPHSHSHSHPQPPPMQPSYPCRHRPMQLLPSRRSGDRYQAIRPPQPPPIRTDVAPAYADAAYHTSPAPLSHHSHHTPHHAHHPDASPSDVYPPEYIASFCKNEDGCTLSHQECLRLRLLEETWLPRQPPPPQPPHPASAGGYAQPHPPPPQWAAPDSRR